MGLDTLKEEVSGTLNTISSIIATNPVASAVVGGGLAAGAVLGAVAIARRKRKKSSKRKSSRKKSSTRRGRRRSKRKLKFGSKAYRKKYLHKHRTSPKGKLTRHKHRGTKAIHYTKKGQPYKILANGRARFIKKSGAKRSRKMKGGYY